MTVRRTFGGAPSNLDTRTIVADAVTDVDPASCRVGDRLCDLTGQNWEVTNTGGTLQWRASSAGGTAISGPVYYVASTGSDGIAHTGSITDPLATPQEASRRLAESGWIGTAFVRTLDTVALGLDPVLSVPAASGPSMPIVYQGTLATDVAAMAATAGGTTGDFFTGPVLTNATIETGVAMVLNEHAGKILRGVGGTLAGKRLVIHSNTTGGQITVAGYLAAAPGVGDTFDILSRTGKWSFSGTFTMTVAGGACLDSIEIRAIGAGGTGANIFCLTGGGELQESGTYWRGNGTASGLMIVLGGRMSAPGGPPYNERSVFKFAGYTPCGAYYDGAVAGGARGILHSYGLTPAMNPGGSYRGCFSSYNSVLFQNVFTCSFNLYFSIGNTFNNTCFNVGGGGFVYLENSRFENGSAGGMGGVVALRYGGKAHVAVVWFAGTTGASDCIALATGSYAVVTFAGGAAPAGRMFLSVATGALATCASNTGVGGTVGLDVSDDGKVLTVAQANALVSIGARTQILASQFATVAAASAVLGVINGGGPVMILSVRKTGEGAGVGTGMLCTYTAASGATPAGFYTSAGVLATE